MTEMSPIQITKMTMPKYISYKVVSLATPPIPLYFDFHRHKCRFAFQIKGNQRVANNKTINQEMIRPIAEYCNRNCNGLWSYHLSDAQLVDDNGEPLSPSDIQKLTVSDHRTANFSLNVMFELRDDFERFMREQALITRLTN